MLKYPELMVGQSHTDNDPCNGVPDGDALVKNFGQVPPPTEVELAHGDVDAV